MVHSPGFLVVFSAISVRIGIVSAFTTPGGVSPATSLSVSKRAHQQQLPTYEWWHDIPKQRHSSDKEASPHWSTQVVRFLGAGFAAGLLAAAVAGASQPAEAYNTPILGKTDWSHDVVRGNYSVAGARSQLEPCAKNKRFAKRIKDELYKVSNKQNKFPEGSVVYNRYVEKTARVKKRQASYGARMCGKKDGLPRALSEPSLARGNTNLPSAGFFYIAGWIGWAGRTYLRGGANVEQEVNIDAPFAAGCMANSFVWPVVAWQEIVNGDYVVADREIHRVQGIGGV